MKIRTAVALAFVAAAFHAAPVNAAAVIGFNKKVSADTYHAEKDTAIGNCVKQMEDVCNKMAKSKEFTIIWLDDAQTTANSTPDHYKATCQATCYASK